MPHDIRIQRSLHFAQHTIGEIVSPMAIVALSASAATLLPFNSCVLCHLSDKTLFHLSISQLTNWGVRSPFCSNVPKRGIQFVTSGAIGKNEGVAELSQLEVQPRIYTWPDNKRPRVCILGGGFGGLYTALRLQSLVWEDDKKPQVLLVDQSEHFVFKPMLYELLSGARLVLALGAEAKLDVVPGATEFAFPFSTIEDACKVDSKLRALERRNFGNESLIHVAVVGCGYSGVELAATISERLKDRGVVQAINVETTICPTAPPGNREAALKVLSSRKVELLLGYYVGGIQKASDPENSAMPTETGAITDISAQCIYEKYYLELNPAERGLQSQILEADLVLWTVGSKSLLSQLEARDQPCELPLNARGQAETDETLRVKGHPRIFALGDSSSLRDSSGRLLPATAQVAFQQADFAGWNIWAAINDRPLLPFRFQNLGEMMTLGRNDAALSPSFIEGLTLEGPIGHAARKIAYLYRLPTDEHRLKVGISWLTKSAIDSVASVQSTLAKVLSGS
ncbi:alternative NAD(P)H-ubiquinone oxidoreductase C1, chloroplastic/mitochondrial isoform X4 [Euphorbia lathyris]|uniref:alternative NAD(P)H-ubiquinone oxidoreductase C1, chloroplastic/mitochondrial isoform X4 n=1 Tax=Euphorbia lathyris TaxID=212925 RepID=UPI0033132002